MEKEIRGKKYDVVIHSAAVSDYKVDGVFYENEKGKLVSVDNSKKMSSQHIDFRNWTNLLLIAPLSANTLTKIANGLCDNFLYCIALAMNTEMWINLATSEHLQLLHRVYQSIKMVEPIEALLA